MNRCLNERALLRVYLKEPTADDASHLRLCADCAERYDAFVDDLQAIDAVLTEPPPPAVARSRVSRWRVGWVPAVAFVALLAVVVGVTALRRSAPLQVSGRKTSVSTFAADVSAALFGSADPDALPPLASDTPDLGAALEVGWPCTREQFFNGECNDQVSVLLFESE